MTRGRSLNLTAALAVAALGDLVLHRLMARLFLPQNPTEGLARAAAAVGRFAFHLGGVLGLLVVAVTLVGALRRSDLFPRSMRFAVGSIALFFATLAALGVLFLRLPDRFVVHLKTSHAFLAWFIVVALWRGAGPARTKVGVTLFGLPVVLHALALFFERAGWARPYPGELARAAEICALVAGALAPYLLAPEPRTGARRLAGVAVGVAALGGLVAALAVRFDLVQALALYGFRLDLPPLTSPGAVTFVGLVIAAFVGLAMAIVWSLSEPGGARLVGYGLVLVAAAGYQTIAPNQVLFATAGLLALAAGTARLTPPGGAEPAPAVSPPAPAA